VWLDDRARHSATTGIHLSDLSRRYSRSDVSWAG
jgi:hypothetical protein